MDGIRIQL